MSTFGGDESHAQIPPHPEAQKMLRLEHFLDVILRRELNQVLNRREAASATVAQCRHLRDLIDSVAVLGTVAAPPSLGSVASHGGGGGGSLLSPQASPSLVPTAVTSDILTNIGNHFYMQCHVPDARTIHINIGCGIVLPMTLGLAKEFLFKKEALLMSDVERLTRESLRIRFRMRLVMEAISRINDAPLAKGTKKSAT